MPIPRHYSYGPRKLNIILTQLRCNASFLNYDLCKVKMLSNASCNCDLKACLKMVIFSSYVRRSLPFVSRFTSILMLEGSQLRLLNIISLLSMYIFFLFCESFYICVYMLLLLCECFYMCVYMWLLLCECFYMCVQGNSNIYTHI
jgi:hypothetical protein